MPENLTRQILHEHLVDGDLKPGEPIALRIDQTLLQDATGTMACMQFEQLGEPRVKVDRAVQYVDHNVIQLDFKNPDDHRMLQAMARKFGIDYSRPGNGICHYVHIERFAQARRHPGRRRLAHDDQRRARHDRDRRRRPRRGRRDGAATRTRSPAPRSSRCTSTGTLDRPWVQAKDIILELLRSRGVSGGKNKVFEFTGQGTADLSMPERGTIANMIAELGATSAVFPPDDATRDWLKRQEREDDFEEIGPDDGAEYDDREEIDLSRARPAGRQAGSNPGNVVSGRGGRGHRDRPGLHGLVGQLRLRGPGPAGRGPGRQGRPDRAPGDRTATATPGSRQILTAIAESGVYRQLVEGGVRMLEPVCGPCVGMGQAPPSDANSLRTMNRNFPGRSGTAEDSRLPVLAGGRGGVDARGQDLRPARVRRPARDCSRCRSSSRTSTTCTSSRRPTRTRPRRSRSRAGRTSRRRRSTSRCPTRSRRRSRPCSQTTSRPATWRPTAPR